MAVTKRKEDERTSSTIYSGLDALSPVVNFDEFLSNDESIVDEVFCEMKEKRNNSTFPALAPCCKLQMAIQASNILQITIHKDFNS